jgi:putative hemolysin
LEDSPDPYSSLATILLAAIQSISVDAIMGVLLMICLLFLSALISGSEVAFFSLTHNQVDTIRKFKKSQGNRMLALLEKPKRLLATILIANNVINIAIILLSTYVFHAFFDFSEHPIFGFIVQVILVTFLIVLLAEVLPKIIASQNPQRFALGMAAPLMGLFVFFKPLSTMLVKSTNMIDKRMAKRRPNISMNDLSQALDITADSDTTDEDKNILKGIVTFGNVYAREIMRPRVDVVAVDVATPFPQLIDIIIEAGYSRVPVFQDSFDNVEGILYIKDLLPFLDKGPGYEWQKLVRNCFFVPESKRISDLLKEFQEKKIHLAVVVDEYGGTSGIVTLEDILEEIVGEINDEFDIEEAFYSRLDANTYVFEGKTLIKDFCKITESEYSLFNEIKGEADTLAGLILEIRKELPVRGEKLQLLHFEFEIDSVDNRRIKRVKVKIMAE